MEVGFETHHRQNVTREGPTMGLLGPLKAFLVVALIRISPSVGDGIGDDIADLSTVSENYPASREYKTIESTFAEI